MNQKLRFFTMLVLISGAILHEALGDSITKAGVPGFGEPGYTAEQVNGAVNAAEAQGLADGRREAAASCLSDPKNCGCNYGLTTCGVSLAALVTGTHYGETEPNDNITSADPIVPDNIYWGQSMSLQDQDWFAVTTEEPNQVITVNFKLPNGSAVGWDISVRDAAGNILSEFPSINATPEFGITYPTFVAFPGTYYIVVQPHHNSTLNSLPYNIIVDLGFSDTNTRPVDVNFFSVETEPNDTAITANPITSTVTMFGTLYSTLAGNPTVGWALQTEQDWFRYTSPGNEIATLAWCQRESCAPSSGRAWRVTVLTQDNTVIASFSTQGIQTGVGSYRTLYLGLAKAGDYFIQVMSELKTTTVTDAHGVSIAVIQTNCRNWSIPQPGQAAVCLSYAPVATVTTDQYNFTWQGTRRALSIYNHDIMVKGLK